MKKPAELLEKPWVANAFALCTAVLLYLLLTHLAGPILGFISSTLGILTPVIIGLVIAYLADALVMLFGRTILKGIPNEGVRRAIGIVITIIVVILAIALLLLTVIPALIDSATQLFASSDSIVEAIKSFLAWLKSLFPNLDLKSTLHIDLDSQSVSDLAMTYVGQFASELSADASEILEGLSRAGTALTNFGLGIILAIYFLASKESLVRGFNRLRRAILPTSSYDRRTEFWHRCHSIVITYFGCSLIDVLIIAGVTAVFMFAMGMPNIALTSITLGIVNLIPVFGGPIGTVIGAFLLVLGNPWDAVWFVVFAVVLIFIDGNVIRPRLFNNSLGIPAVWTIIAIIVGGALFGVAGMLLAIPFAAVATFAYTEMLLPWLEARRARLDTGKPMAGRLEGAGTAEADAAETNAAATEATGTGAAEAGAALDPQAEPVALEVAAPLAGEASGEGAGQPGPA